VKQHKGKGWVAILPTHPNDLNAPYDGCNSWRIWAIITGQCGQYTTIQTFRDEQGRVVDLEENHPRVELKGQGTKSIIG